MAKVTGKMALVSGAVYLALGVVSSAAGQADPGAHEHDGLYARASIGPSALYSSIDTNRESDATITVLGGALGLDLMLGGTPWPGFVIGGLIMADLAPDPHVELGGRDAGEFAAWCRMLAAFVDVHFDPRGGLHAGAAAGFGSYTVDADATSRDDDQSHDGPGLMLWTGYDFWVAPQWSIGGALRLSGFTGWHDVLRDGAGVTQQVLNGSVALMVNVLYH
jgi:hypothetical protein